MDLLKFIFIYTLLILSILGYGIIFSTKLTKYNNFQNKNLSIGYIGIFGIFILIFISYLTNFFYPHNNLHNIIIIIIGVITFFYFLIKKKIKISKYFLFAYLISFFALFYFKSHDDFSYYHLSLINNITKNKIEFGISHFDIGFNHVSSLFYFHSLFKTLFTGDYFFQLAQISIFIFVNTIIFENVFKIKNKEYLNTSFFLNIFLIIFLNVFFYRLAEHGTDRSAQILFFLVFILTIDLFDNRKIKKDIFELIIILFTLIISIKSFYILYSILFFFIYFKYFKVNDFLKIFKFFPILYFCCFILLFTIISNIASSGCLIYPVANTCFDLFFWGYGKQNVISAMEWYEIWSKAGATPNYRVENFSEYLKNFNWVSNWIETYFFNKMSDFLLGTLFVLIIVSISFKLKKISIDNFKKYSYFFLILFFLILEWFLNHPSLRYGGYVLFFIFFTFPVSIMISNQNYKFKNLSKSIKIIFCITIVIFISRNLNRLVDEYLKYNYNFIKNPYYNVQENYFTLKNNKKQMFYDISICKEENSIANIKCKRIYGYNFYFNKNN